MGNTKMENYMEEQIKILTSQNYREKAAKELNKKNPTPEEVAEYYIRSRDAEKYDEKHPHY